MCLELKCTGLKCAYIKNRKAAHLALAFESNPQYRVYRYYTGNTFRYYRESFSSKIVKGVHLCNQCMTIDSC